MALLRLALSQAAPASKRLRLELPPSQLFARTAPYVTALFKDARATLKPDALRPSETGSSYDRFPFVQFPHRASFLLHSPRHGSSFGALALGQACALRTFASSATSGEALDPPSAPQPSAASDDVSGASSFVDTVKEGLEKGRQGVETAWASLPPSVHEVLNPKTPVFVVAAQELGLLTAVIFTWFKMPRWFRRLHDYTQSRTLQTKRFKSEETSEQSGQGPALLMEPAPVPYEQSIWAAAEEPARLLVTVGALAHLIGLVAPHALPPEYLHIAWRGAVVGSWLWFLYRYKNTWFSRAKTNPALSRAEKDRYVAAERLSTVALVVLGSMAVAETTGVAVQSILTVGGIGGVATAFAARDILGNFLNGAALYLYTPFSIGDNIKAGSLEGTVVDIGLHSTHLVDQDKHAVVVPNSFFSNQVITNRSRTEGRLLSAKIPLPPGLVDRAPELTAELREYLRNRPEVAVGKEAPKVYLSSLGSPANAVLLPEVTLTCHTTVMGSAEYGLLLEDILHHAAQLVEKKEREGERGLSEPQP
ncbi:Mechanosensitive ion channel protein [Klebsormidium nitens]|uniref:Mechanosensitive ion channel protein n=1 Tax=Klebsormidium nitens TaxID=105231 RepID=A0A1Y1HWK4_KLENI|nr:Mechanosensitive ion channel protein [Klebsormidium nitens]|eukprot:GAQ80907.1 Mechanosensitive ion channel protein [Klebsormidium nitens]